MCTGHFGSSIVRLAIFFFNVNNFFHLSASLVIASHFRNSWSRGCRMIGCAFYSSTLPPPVSPCSIFSASKIRFSVASFSFQMDIPRVTPPSIHIDHDFPGMNGPERPSNRSIMNPFQRTQRPMAIPGSAAEIYAPPPLPPPRYIEEDAAGGDYGAQWRNSLDSSSFESGGSVSSRSSLRGNWDRKVAGGRATGRPDCNRRTSAAMKLPSQPEMDTRYDHSRHVDEGYHSLSGSSLVNQSVHKVFFGFTIGTCSAAA